MFSTTGSELSVVVAPNLSRSPARKCPQLGCLSVTAGFLRGSSGMFRVLSLWNWFSLGCRYVIGYSTKFVPNSCLYSDESKVCCFVNINIKYNNYEVHDEEVMIRSGIDRTSLFMVHVDKVPETDRINQLPIGLIGKSLNGLDNRFFSSSGRNWMLHFTD